MLFLFFIFLANSILTKCITCIILGTRILLYLQLCKCNKPLWVPLAWTSSLSYQSCIYLKHDLHVYFHRTFTHACTYSQCSAHINNKCYVCHVRKKSVFIIKHKQFGVITRISHHVDMRQTRDHMFICAFS